MSKQEEDNLQREFKKIVDGIITFNDKVGGHLPNIAMSINSSLFNYMNSKEMERQQMAAKIEAELNSLDVSDSVKLEDINNCEECEGQNHKGGCDGCKDNYAEEDPLEGHYQDMADHQEEIEEACKPETEE